MQYRLAIVMLAIVMLTAGPARGEPRDPWAPRDVCVFGMPYLGHAVKPQQGGLITAILQVLFEHENIQLYHERLPYERALEEISAGSGKVHMTLSIKGHANGLPQGTATIATYDLAAAYKFRTGFDGAKSLKGKDVAYLHGFNLASFLPVKVKAHLVYDLSSGFHMLDRNQVEYMLGDISLLRGALLDSQLPSGNILLTQMATYEVRPVFAPTTMGRKFRDVYDRRMKAIIASGEFEEILLKYQASEAYIKKLLSANSK